MKTTWLTKTEVQAHTKCIKKIFERHFFCKTPVYYHCNTYCFSRNTEFKKSAHLKSKYKFWKCVYVCLHEHSKLSTNVLNLQAECSQGTYTFYKLIRQQIRFFILIVEWDKIDCFVNGYHTQYCQELLNVEV